MASSNRNLVITILVVICLVSLGYYLYQRRKQMADKAAADKAAADKAAADKIGPTDTMPMSNMAPIPQPPGMSTMAPNSMPPVVIRGQIVSIELTHDWLLNLGELGVHTASGILKADDFSSITYPDGVQFTSGQTVDDNRFPASNLVDGVPYSFVYPGGVNHKIRAVLKVPTVVTSVSVWNRVDCCQDRALGVKVRLFDTTGAVYREFTMTDAAGEQVFPV
jgi:hypothetical protein